jgi:hypothetical protein
LIFGKKVNAYYIDILTNPFEHMYFEEMKKEKVKELKGKKKNKKN